MRNHGYLQECGLWFKIAYEALRKYEWQALVTLLIKLYDMMFDILYNYRHLNLLDVSLNSKYEQLNRQTVKYRKNKCLILLAAFQIVSKSNSTSS
jgi:hypothetical protein